MDSTVALTCSSHTSLAFLGDPFREVYAARNQDGSSILQPLKEDHLDLLYCHYLQQILSVR